LEIVNHVKLAETVLPLKGRLARNPR